MGGCGEMVQDSGLATRPTPAPLWRVAAMFALVAAILYGNSLHTPFLLDDQFLHSREPSMRSPAAALASPWPRRLGMLTFALNYHWHGLWMPGYHAVNIAIHWLAAVMLFALLRGTLTRGSPNDSTATVERSDLWAGLVALVWLIHPLQTGSVTYVIQRFESLMGCFVLVSLYAVMRAAAASVPLADANADANAEATATATSESSSHWASEFASRLSVTWRNAVWQAVAVGAAFAAAATKEVAVVLPLLALAYDRIYWANSWREVLRRRAPLYAGMILAGAAVVYHSSYALSGTAATSAGFNVPGLTWWHYLRSQPEVLLHYLWLAIWPSDLCFDYGWPVAMSPWHIYPAGLVIVGLLAATCWLMAKAPRIGFLGCAFFLLLAPTSSFMPLMDLAFEHRMYLPLAPVMAALALAIEWALARWLPCPARRRAALALGAAIVCSGLGTRTFLRNRDYADPLRMWESVVSANPAGNRGHLMFALQLTAIGRLEEAEKHYRLSLTLRKDLPEAHVGLGYVRMKQGKLDEAERFLRLGVEHPRTTHVAHYNLGKLRERQGRLRHALDHYQWSVAAQADYTQSWEALAVVAGKLGKRHLEIVALRRLVEIDPHTADPAIRLARLLATADESDGGAPPEALAMATRLLDRRDVDRRAALECLATAEWAMGRFAAAKVSAAEALRLPGDTLGRRRLEAIQRAELPGRRAAPDRVSR
ncbi:MAG: tetratricopeptide repeat protein [Planctomycetota bacterium]